MYRAAIVVMLLVLSVGCSDADVVSLSSSEKAELEILYAADKVESIRVALHTSEGNDEFDVPAEFVTRVLDAMKPVGRVTKHTKCMGIADVKVNAKGGKGLDLFVHTYRGGFAAKPSKRDDSTVYFAGNDAERLRRVLSEARKAAEKK